MRTSGADDTDLEKWTETIETLNGGSTMSERDQYKLMANRAGAVLGHVLENGREQARQALDELIEATVSATATPH